MQDDDQLLLYGRNEMKVRLSRAYFPTLGIYNFQLEDIWNERSFCTKIVIFLILRLTNDQMILFLGFRGRDDSVRGRVDPRRAQGHPLLGLGLLQGYT